jgi:hypothetical protein
MKVNDTIANGFAADLLAAIDADAGAGTLKFYDGTQPAGPDTAVTSQTLLGTLTLSDPAGSVTGRVLTFSAITEDSSADATGTCTWARLLDNSGDAIADFTVTATGGGGDIEINSTNIVAGGPIQVTSGSVTF